MGINILVHGYPDNKWDSNYDVKWWESSRFVGDREFIALEFDREYRPSMADDDTQWRPKNFDEWREWVRKFDMVPGNRRRLLDLLTEMETDPNLWIDVSY